MSLTKTDHSIVVPTRHTSVSQHKFIVWDIALLALVLLSVGLLVFQANPSQMEAWLASIPPDRFADLHEQVARGAAEQLTTPQLIAAMQDPDPAIRVSAAQALGWRRASEATDTLLEATNDPDARVQEEAAAALGEIGQIQVLPRLEALQVVQGNSNVQLAAFEAQDQLTGRIAAGLMVPRSEVQTVAVAPSGAAFAAISDDLYSLDNGAWHRIRHLPVSPNGIAVGPDGQAMFLATDSPGLYRSRDGGKTWEHGLFRVDSSALPVVTAAVIDPSDPQRVYVALASQDTNGEPSSSFGIFESRDGGSSWNPLPASPTDTVTRKLILDPATQTFLYGLTDGGPFRLTLAGDVTDSVAN